MKILKLIGFVLLCEAAGAIGSVFTFPAIATWYASLDKPWFNPPNFIFGPARALLFALMGISLFLVWEKGVKKKQQKIAIGIFAIQFILNVFWSILFFGLQSPLLAFIEIIVLWISILATIIAFWKISKKAALLLVPYLAWVSFAAILNFAVFLLN